MKSFLHTAAAKAAVFVVLTTPVLGLSLLGSRSATAQVDIVESSPIIRPIGQTPGVTSSNNPEMPEANPLDDLFTQIQTLQRQVQQQTGLIEELSYELKRLKQQRMDDYIDLDRRLSELSQGGVGTARNPVAANSNTDDAVRPNGAATNSSSTSARPAVANNNPASAQDETAVFRAANDLISAREWDKAIVAYQGYLNDFPGGRYESNAHYWLGELYFLKNDFTNARQSFEQVINQFPGSNKVDTSKLKLGRTYFELGDKAKAKTLLEEVASSNNDSSRQAALFIRENF